MATGTSTAAISSRDLSTRLWREFDEQLTRLYWEPFWDRLCAVVNQTPDSAQFRKRSGEIHRSRLAKRLGIDNSSLSKKHWGGSKMQVRNLLIPLAVCNIDLSEINFPSPVVAVLNAFQSIIPIADTLLSGEGEADEPTIEELLVLYFAFNSLQLAPVSKVHATHVLEKLDPDFAIDVLAQAHGVECDRSVDQDVEALKVVTNPRVIGSVAVRRVVLTYGDTWSSLRTIFPFLVSAQLSTDGKCWEPGWGFI